MENRKKNVDEKNLPLIHELIKQAGGSVQGFEEELIMQMIQTSLKLITDEHTTAQIKLINRALKEMRYAYRIFNQYLGLRCLSIFGSARTPPNHPDYIAAKAFSKKMADKDWMCITGAANGIMKAGHEGTTKEARFGLSIRLAFESDTPIMEGDPKLISFRYFFTRKLMFMSHSDAIAVFPGGVGTMDELYEALTLMQTGKSNLIPLVLVEGEGGKYWPNWRHYYDQNLLANGWVGEDDHYLFHIATSIDDAVAHIERFFHRYHSLRFVKDLLVIRIKQPLTEEQLAQLNKQFAPLLKTGEIKQSGALEEEKELPELTRITLYFNRKNYGLLRAMIDQINAF